MKNVRLTILYLSIILSSCTSISYVQIETLSPAELDIPVQLDKIVLIDRRSFDLTNFVTKNSYNTGLILKDISYTQMETLDSLISDYYLGSIIENIKVEPRYNMVKAENLQYRKNEKLKINPLNWEEVDSIAISYDADGILSYESGYYIDRYYQDKVGGMIKASLEIQIISNWILYDNINKSTIKIFNRDTSFVDVYGYDNYDISKALPDPVSVLKECGINSGLSMIQKISPYWVEENRFYFTGPGKKLREAEKLVEGGNWESAATIWNDLATNGTNLLASRAKFNMALACEVQGKPDLSLEWMHDLYIPLWHEYLDTYQKEIKKSVKNKKILNRQFKQ